MLQDAWTWGSRACLAAGAGCQLEGVRMARHKMFVDASKAERDLGFAPGPIEAALGRAVAWYESNGYIVAGRTPAIAGARQGSDGSAL